MITFDLIEYIKSQLNKNISKNTIVYNLSKVGWHSADIEEGFTNINNKIEEKHLDPFLKKENIFDKYRESTDGVEQIKDKVKETIESEKNKITDISTSVINTEVSIDSILNKNKVISSDVSQSVDIGINKKDYEISNSTDIEPYKIEVAEEKVTNSNPVLINLNKVASIQENESEKIEPSVNIELSKEKDKITDIFIPTINKTPFNLPKNDPKNSEKIFTPEITVPLINENSDMKAQIDSIVNGTKKDVPVKPSSLSEFIVDVSPKNAMISSYSQDVLLSKNENVINDNEEETNDIIVPSKKKNNLLKFGIIAFVVSIICGMIFAFVQGYIKFPWSKFSLSVVKKDPKIILLESPTVISSLKSYKVDTNIKIISPSLSNITTGLSSGEVVKSNEKDSITIGIKGIINSLNSKKYLDYNVDVSSSILKNNIISNWKYDGSKIYISIPDLKQVIKNNYPEPSDISLSPNQFGLILGEFSNPVQNIIKRIDSTDILSHGLSSSMKNEVFSIFREFIGSLEYRALSNELIHGVDTYHYEMVVTKPSTKKVLSRITDLFFPQLNSDQKKNLDEIIGSSSISSFEVWADKNNDSLYQIKFVLNVPLSRVLGLNDSGIAGNEVKLDWITTFYDLNIENNINIPSNNINVETFINNIKDIKIKNSISTFKPQVNLLKNAIGSYGIRSNPAGSCTNPNPGSLFSPQGHKKVADNAVSSISSSMISILSATNGAGYCYSTPSSWALSVPLNNVSHNSLDVNSIASPLYYCVDSTGTINTLSTVIKGPVCK